MIFPVIPGVVRKTTHHLSLKHGRPGLVSRPPSSASKTFTTLGAYPMPQKKVDENYSDFLEGFFGIRTLEKEDASLNTLLDELPMCLWMHDEQYLIIYANRAVEERFGQWHGQKCYEFFMGENNICNCCQSKSILAGGQDERCTHCKRSNKTFDIDIYHILLVHKDCKKIIIKSNMHIQDINILYRKH